LATDIYVVQPDDTMGGIANRFGFPVSEILELNRLSPLEKLVVGQAILIPFLPKTIESLAYFHLADVTELANTLEEIGQLVTYGAVFQFSVAADGSIAIPEGADVEGTVGLLRSYNILPLLVLTNLSPQRFEPALFKTAVSSEPNKAKIIANLVSLLERYGFAGVNIDFENVSSEDREAFTAFIRDLKLVLEERSYLVTLAVPPKNSDTPDNPAHLAYDLQALGNWSDFLFVMAYDWGYVKGPPEAVAPLNKVQEVMTYLTGKVPASKLMLGIPLYGYDWQLPYTPGTAASVVNLVKAIELARRYQAVIQYDPVAQSPYFKYVDTAGKEHIVWFEDARSVTGKYQLTRGINLRGAGFWSSKNTPYGFPQNWVIFQEMLQPMKGAILI
jgi:spore germination protein